MRILSAPLAKSVDPYLFKDIHIGLYEESLNKLICIAASDRLKSLVETITLHPDVLPLFPGFDEWVRSIKKESSESDSDDDEDNVVHVPGTGPATDYLRSKKIQKVIQEFSDNYNTYERYVKMASFQRKWHDSEEIREQLSTAMASLKMLKRFNARPYYDPTFPKLNDPAIQEILDRRNTVNPPETEVCPAPRPTRNDKLKHLFRESVGCCSIGRKIRAAPWCWLSGAK
ncbi:hypothetical protein EJ08DRAFT_698580 [Tothia fuscella]|uniref:Uncharacterized protein n=1 Tax=Tothia fuscella TaxID=1048955 RepID=A0A9P4NQ30_9PEZI|nr:hypothetical protein EJ08DRAFT_698580 [Tothia fuscella]